MRSALGHVLHVVSHHDGRWETVAEGRCLPARRNDYVLAADVYPRGPFVVVSLIERQPLLLARRRGRAQLGVLERRH